MKNRTLTTVLLIALIMAACATPAEIEESPQPVPVDTAGPDNESEGGAEVTETIESTDTPLPQFDENSISPGTMQAHSFFSSDGSRMDYLLYIPEGYDEEQNWPLLLSLHGDRGITHTVEVVEFMTPLASFDSYPNFPFILVAPVSPSANWKFFYEPVNELVDSLIESLPINPESIILTGASAGAYGGWEYVFKNPNQFAAFVPVAGGPGDNFPPENICLLKNLPIWIFHSEVDYAMRIDSSYAALEALESCDSNSIWMTTFDDLGHVDSIVSAYSDPALYEWMLQQVE